MKGLKIDGKALEEGDFYSLSIGEVPGQLPPGEKPPSKGGKLPPSQFYGVFQCDNATCQSDYVIGLNPLERAVRNIKIYRHPNVLKYVSSWKNGTLTFLATEECKPLVSILATLTDIELCLGLKGILQALIFLVEHAETRHLNVAVSSIYVNTEGVWKLFGFEHVWKASEVTAELLDKAKPFRYANGMANAAEMETIEQYAFATLCEDVLKGKKQGSFVDEFREYCAVHLKHADEMMRPKLQAVLLHPFFNHDFIQIHSYLIELPLKSPESKQEFFSVLADQLRAFDEVVVASQLGWLLVSRLVLLDTAAKAFLLPYLLRPRSEDVPTGLFSAETFEKYLIPRLKTQFGVLDAQIRISLLEFFPAFVELFNKDDLKNDILPQLLLGMKDTNDLLVSRTLFCMADLVQILGANDVVSSERTKIFSDGRPQGPETLTKYTQEPRSITPVMAAPEDLLSVSPTPTEDISTQSEIVTVQKVMPERLSPEGADNGEEVPTPEVDGDEWSDWDTKDDSKSVVEAAKQEEQSQPSPVKPTPRLKTAATHVHDLDSIDALDIKNQVIRTTEANDEFDFFKDMEPQIQSTGLLILTKETAERAKQAEGNSKDVATTSSNRLTIVADTEEAHGWDEDDTWGE